MSTRFVLKPYSGPMRLLVSVTNAGEAAAAVDGGADVVDAKDPRAGSLGAVTLHRLQEIIAAVGQLRPVSAALGDAADERTIECAARRFAGAGADFVKVGFAGITSCGRVEKLITATVHGAGPSPASGVVAVAYADVAAAQSLSPDVVADAAFRAGAVGVLLDTADKHGPTLTTLMSPRALASWIARTHGRGLFAAIAGKLTADDLAAVRDCGADIAGVRGAACDGGRTGRVTAERVRLLKSACEACGSAAVWR